MDRTWQRDLSGMNRTLCAGRTSNAVSHASLSSHLHAGQLWLFGLQLPAPACRKLQPPRLWVSSPSYLPHTSTTICTLHLLPLLRPTLSFCTSSHGAIPRSFKKNAWKRPLFDSVPPRGEDHAILCAGRLPPLLHAWPSSLHLSILPSPPAEADCLMQGGSAAGQDSTILKKVLPDKPNRA